MVEQLNKQLLLGSNLSLTPHLKITKGHGPKNLPKVGPGVPPKSPPKL